MKRILITLDFPPEIGGVQRYLHDRVAHAYADGDEVIAGCASPAPRPAAIAKIPIRYVAWFPARWNKKWSLVPLAAELLRARRQSTDLSVECGNVYAGLAAWFVSLFTGTRYGVYAYGTELLDLKKPSLRSFLLRAVLRRADRLYVLGGYTQTLLADAGIRRTTECIPPRIDLPRDGTKWRPAHPAQGTSIILCVARLVPHKGHAVLLDAVSRLPPAVRWKLVIIGCGPEQESLNRRCRSGGMEDRVTFLPRVDDGELHRHYLSASALVLPSLETSAGTEGFGIVLLEAMAFSVPVIASRVGGIPEVLENGACGVLVEPGDATALAGALHDVYNNPAGYEPMTRRAHQRLVDRYTWTQEAP
jgi:glycosyltransferase involved in cell wall biosynthesis